MDKQGTNTAEPGSFEAIVGGLSDELKGHVESNGYKSFDDIIKSDQTAMQRLGSSFSEPKGTREEDPDAWARIDKITGVPEDGKYTEFKPGDDFKGTLNEDLISTFDEGLAAAKVPQSARDAALGTVLNLQQKMIDDDAKAFDDEKVSATEALKKELDTEYKTVMDAADGALEGIDGSEPFLKLMEDYGLKDHPTVQRLLGEVGRKRGEDGGLPSTDNGGKGATMTKDEAQAKKESLKKDRDWVKKFNDGDPEAMKELSALNEIIAHPDKKGD